jgi:hypothetical protein
MRASKRLAPLAALTAALAAAGCGLGGSPATSHNVALSISAPTSGATVAVRQVTVLGKVTPANARVLVNGQTATVSGGNYQRTLYVGAAQQTITVVGEASGYRGGQASTTVNFSSALASQLSATTSRLRHSPSPAAGSQLAPASKNQLQAAFALTGSGQSGQSPAAKSSAPQKPSGSPASGGSGSSGSAGNQPSGGGSSGGGGGTSSGPSSNPSPPSGPTPTQVRAAIKKAYVGLCEKSEKGKNLVPYCRCMYNHLESAGSLSSNSRLRALRKAMQPYYRTHDPAKLPRVMRRALDACETRLPPADPLGGPPTVTKFPGVGHPTTTPAPTGPS